MKALVVCCSVAVSEGQHAEYCRLMKALVELLGRDSETKAPVFALLNAKSSAAFSVWAQLGKDTISRFTS